jgi:hypothetical protein
MTLTEAHGQHLALPDALARQIDQAVPRPWLIERLEHLRDAARPRTGRAPRLRTIIVVGPPGTGKTTLAGQLARRWDALFYSARFGSTAGAVWADPKNCFVSLGLQLRARYGPALFACGDEREAALTVRATVGAGRVEAGGTVAAVEVGRAWVSPFRRILIDAAVDVGELAGDAIAVRINELTDVTVSMTPAQLAREALAEPLQRLAERDPERQVTIVVDALDESLDFASQLPVAGELPDNTLWVLLSRPGDHLNRFRAAEADGETAVLDLSEGDHVTRSVDDAVAWARVRLDTPSLRATYERAPGIAHPFEQAIRKVGAASRGNFLFLHYLLAAIEADAATGNLSLLLAPLDQLPKGLDGIYRYFLSDRIRGGVGMRDWVELYVPVLGVLAVARDPLCAEQVAAFSAVKVLLVQEVLGAVAPFVECVPMREGLGYALYHRSLADYLFTTDRARNPYPLESPAHYHTMIAGRYRDLTPADWQSSSDRYALLHLPGHLIAAGEVDWLCALLRGPFAERQTLTVGSARTYADSVAAMRAAAKAGRDAVMLLVLERSIRARAALGEEWASGRHVLDLLVDDPALLLERKGYGADGLGLGAGEPSLPWSAFLTAERLLDLGATEQARRVLRTTARRPWTGETAPERARFRATPIATGMLEGSNVDFVLPTGAVLFLARVAELDAGLALRLTRRVFAAPQELLPNDRTAWRNVLRVALAKAGTDRASGAAPPLPKACRALVDTTCEWLREGGVNLGWAGLAQAVFELLRYAARVPGVEPLWAVNALLVATGRRLDAALTIQGAADGADKSPGLDAATADVLSALADAGGKLQSADGSRGESTDGNGYVTDPAGATAIADMRQRILDDLSPPRQPTAGTRSYRAAALARMSHALHRLGAPAWRAYADAALASCELDAAMAGPWLAPVAESLAWLARIPDAEIQRAARTTRDRLGAAGLSNLDVEPRAYGEAEMITALSEPPSAERLADAGDMYERSRLALALWRRAALTRDELGERLAPARPPGPRGLRRSDEPLPAFRDVVAESLHEALAYTCAPWSEDLMDRLDAARTPERRERRTIDASAVQAGRWEQLARVGDTDRLGAEVHAEYLAAVARRDYNASLRCCLQSTRFDPDLANRRYRELAAELQDPDRGFVIAALVSALHGFHPERMADLGVRWAGDLPVPRAARDIARYQTLVCEGWGAIEEVESSVAVQAHHIARALPDYLARLQKDEEGADHDRLKLWQAVGDVLFSVGQIPSGGRPAMNEAVGAVARAVEGLWADARRRAEGWERQQLTRNILKGLDRDEKRNPIAAPPVAGLAAEMFEDLAREVDASARGGGKSDADAERPTSGVNEDLVKHATLGAGLATQLKRAEPAWSAARFERAVEVWKVLLREPLPPAGGGLMGWVAGIGSLLEARGEFGGKRERLLFELTEALASWCAAEPPSATSLAALQREIARLDDSDLRILLSSPIAAGWLALRDLQRALALVQAADHDTLAKGPFFGRLVAMASGGVVDDPSAIADLEEIILTLIAQTPLEGGRDAVRDVLVAWWLMRARGGARDVRARCEFVQSLGEWCLAAIKAGDLAGSSPVPRG